jgi:hypothetical protein
MMAAFELWDSAKKYWQEEWGDYIRWRDPPPRSAKRQNRRRSSSSASSHPSARPRIASRRRSQSARDASRGSTAPARATARERSLPTPSSEAFVPPQIDAEMRHNNDAAIRGYSSFTGGYRFAYGTHPPIRPPWPTTTSIPPRPPGLMPPGLPQIQTTTPSAESAPINTDAAITARKAQAVCPCSHHLLHAQHR